MPNDRKRLIGRVVSDKMDKTVVVAIDRRKMHRVTPSTRDGVKQHAGVTRRRRRGCCGRVLAGAGVAGDRF